MVVPRIWVPIPKTRVNCPNVKNNLFLHFLVILCKKIQVAANRTILILEGLSIVINYYTVPYTNHTLQCIMYSAYILYISQEQRLCGEASVLIQALLTVTEGLLCSNLEGDRFDEDTVPSIESLLELLGDPSLV